MYITNKKKQLYNKRTERLLGYLKIHTTTILSAEILVQSDLTLMPISTGRKDYNSIFQLRKLDKPLGTYGAQYRRHLNQPRK